MKTGPGAAAKAGIKTPTPTGGRSGFLDAARGLAMAGIVLGHVMVGVSDAKIGGSTFGGVTSALYLIHVPVFAFVSGLMLGNSATQRGRWPYFMDKAGNLLWLYVVWTAIQGAFELLANSLRNNQTSLESILDLWTPIGHLWFLSWLIVSTAVALLVRPWLGGFVRSALTCLLVVISFVAWGYEGTTVAERGLALIGLYLLGATLTHERFVGLANRTPLSALAAIFAVSTGSFVSIVAGTHFSTPSSMDATRTLGSIAWGIAGTVSGMTLVLVLLLAVERAGLRLRLFEWIRRNTMPVFLMHIIFAAGTRILLLRLQVTETWIHVVVATAVGVFLPPLLSRPLTKIPGLFSVPWPSPRAGSTPTESVHKRKKETGA